VHHEGNRADQDTEVIRHGEGTDRDQLGVESDIRSGTAVPPTVLVTEMDHGALILQDRPDGPRVYLGPGDAIALRRELISAFGNAERRLHDGRGVVR
jgi:hypothetical protein